MFSFITQFFADLYETIFYPPNFKKYQAVHKEEGALPSPKASEDVKKTVSKTPVSAKSVIPTPTPEHVYQVIDFGHALITEAEKYIGVQDGGKNAGEQVEKFQKDVDGKATNEAWCMAFVQYCTSAVVEEKKAIRVIPRSEHCLTVWNKTSVNHRYASPEVGRLVIWQHGDTANGHVGIVTRVIDFNTIETIEGNTGPDDKTVEREGDGVYRKIRKLNVPGANMKVKGFLDPFAPMKTRRHIS